MKDKVTITRKYLYLSLTLLGIVLAIVSLYTFIYDYISIENSIFISSKVTALNVNDNTATVKYIVNNKEYESKIPNDSDYAVNDKTMVRVSIKNPLHHVRKHYLISIPSGILGIILLLFTLKKSINYLKKAHNIRLLRTAGMFIQATITEIYVNNLGPKYKGLFPYRLRAKYLNPSDNDVYVFDSDDTYINISDVLAKYGTKGVVVYIDSKNPKNYYVDLNSLIPHVDLIDPIEFMKTKAQNAENTEETTEVEKKDENSENNPEQETETKEQNSKESTPVETKKQA